MIVGVAVLDPTFSIPSRAQESDCLHWHKLLLVSGDAMDLTWLKSVQIQPIECRKC